MSTTDAVLVATQLHMRFTSRIVVTRARSRAVVRSYLRLTLTAAGLCLSRWGAARCGAPNRRRVQGAAQSPPQKNLCLQAGDRIAVLARSYKDAAPPETIRDAVELPEKPATGSQVCAQRRVLVLGWNHRVPLMLAEFAAYPKEEFNIDIVSQVSSTKRQKRIAAEGHALESLKIRQLEFDFTVPAYLDDIDLASYDNVVLLASERLKSCAESNARTILGYLLLRELLAAGAQAPPVLVELIDPDHIALFENRRGEIVVSPVIVSHMLSRVTLRRELHTVFDELFGSVGSEILFRRIADYDLDGGDFNFADLQRPISGQ